ncbi:MAG: NADH-quinone oxidoreductase subunit M [Alphaproteobacteria bacterium]|nr:NADH-quinone oxidoreductase subunit M [Alphaproteobacteria bacterium]
MNEFPLLTLNVFLPSLGALIIALFFNAKDRNAFFIKATALVFSLCSFILSLYFYYSFSKGLFAEYQFENKFFWFPSYNINFHLGIDAISLPFILLSNFLVVISILYSWNNVKYRLKTYMISFLFLQTLVMGAFAAVDVILFYIFFESVLIPMFFIIGIWGGENKVYAAYKFFLYTLFGSIFMLIAIIYAYQISDSANMVDMTGILAKKSLNVQRLIWLGLFVSFAIKVPMIPLHTWLPDAHVQAPTAGSVMLAGVLLKMGGYGFLRLSLPMLPEASHYFFDFVAVLSVIAIIYASFLAFVQTNIKKLIAYSSIAHMGYVTIAIFSGNIYGLQGGIFQMISHGLVSAGLFLVVGMLSDRTNTKEISKYGGFASRMPNLAIIFALLVLASIALPGTSGFIGEFMSLISIYDINKFYTFLAATGMILGAVYMLYLYKRVMLGKNINNDILDINVMEKVVLLPIVILILLFGIYPSILTGITEVAAGELSIYFQSFK